MQHDRDHIHIIKRMSAPTDYCYEPHGTQWHMITDDGNEICYVQMSLDESRPWWVRYGLLLESYMHHKLEDADFMADVIKKFPSRFS
jgi:hypothetical protein